MTIKAALREYRKEKGLSQTELAEKIGVSQNTVSSWETGRTEPSMRDIKSLCDVLGLSVEQLSGTKARELGEISYEDVLVKVRSLELTELRELAQIIHDTIATKEQIAQLTRMHAEQEKRLREYTEKIKALESKLGN